jgi:hypothetical protein
MEGMACSVNPDNGQVDVDVELSDDDEVVHDGTGISGRDDAVLTSNSSGIYLLKDINQWVETELLEEDVDTFLVEPTLRMSNIKDAGLTQKGFVTLQQTSSSCNVSFIEDLETVSMIDLPAEQCPSGAQMIASATGTQAFIFSSAGLFSVTHSGVEKFSDFADVAAYNETTQRLFVANNATKSGLILDVNGQEIASVALPGLVQAAQGFVQEDQFALTISMNHGGAFAVLSSDGELGKTTDIPEATELELSADGSRVAFLLDNDVHFFDIN